MRQLILSALCAALLAMAGCADATAGSEMNEEFEHLYADNDGVRIHYAAAGSGPLVVFIHGFPDFWYSWRHQLAGLRGEYRVAAMDLRGYNLSDQPPDQEDYATRHLIGDVAAVVRAEGRESAVIVGHDWGGSIAWQTAFALPQMVERLIIVNLPHPKGLSRELANNPEQQANSAYARNFQRPDSHLGLDVDRLARAASEGDPAIHARYVEAFERSSLEAMMFYYRQNYPREPYTEIPSTPIINVPVLQFHGLQDEALIHQGLNGTWEWIGQDYTLVTIPDAGHWSQHDAADLVTETMRWWLAARR
jgi:epoxide hydrolase 4